MFGKARALEKSMRGFPADGGVGSDCWQIAGPEKAETSRKTVASNFEDCTLATMFTSRLAPIAIPLFFGFRFCFLCYAK